MEVVFKNITKQFENKQVLNKIDLIIPSNSVYLVVGRNGAGKTTLLRILQGLYKADTGSVSIDGKEVGKQNFKSIKKKIGFLNDKLGLFKDLTAWDNIEFFHRIYFPRKTGLQRVNDIKNIFIKVGLYEHRHRKIDFFSRGMRQRLALARSIINEPDILILDEPHRGLDVEGKELLKSIILEYKEKGATIIINSHDLNDVEEYVTHVAFLNNGEIVEQCSYEELYKEGLSLTELYKKNIV